MNFVNKSANTRILINTGILYFKLIFTIVVNLYSTRLILNAMGVEDFGIVNLVSGIVAMLSFFQNSMTISTQRFLSVNMGKNDSETQMQIFNTSFVIHVLLGIALVLLLELLSPLIFNSSIQIPVDRLDASQLLYQLTIVGTFLMIVTVPYDATLNAHENMLIYSIACIIESIIRLIGALVIVHYHNDKLVFYGVLLISIRLISMLFKRIYCRMKYNDAQIKISKFNKNCFWEMLSFAGWNAIGGFSVSLRSQGMAIVLNVFQGVCINAAYGIANQLLGQLTNFTATISKAMAPQIMQCKGSGDEKHMISLSIKQCKYSFILLLFFVVPLYSEMPLILRLWLKQIPEHGIVFCRLILLVALVQQLTIGLQTLIQANGNIAFYQTTMSFFIMLNIPLASIVLNYGLSPYFVIYIMIFVEIICLVIRVVFAHRLVNLSYKLTMNTLILPIVIITIASVAITLICFYSHDFFSDYVSLFINLIMSWTLLVMVVFAVMSDNERSLVISFIKKITFRKIGNDKKIMASNSRLKNSQLQTRRFISGRRSTK